MSFSQVTVKFSVEGLHLCLSQAIKLSSYHVIPTWVNVKILVREWNFYKFPRIEFSTK